MPIYLNSDANLTGISFKVKDGNFGRQLINKLFVKVKAKVVPYSIRADPGLLAVSPQVINPVVCCHYFPLGPRLPSQPKSVSVLAPFGQYQTILLGGRGMCV